MPDATRTEFMARIRRYLGIHLLHVLTGPLDGLPPVQVAHAGLRYLPLREQDALAWCADPELALVEAQVRAAYSRGDLCIGVTESGIPVGYVWFAFGAAPHQADVWVEFDASMRYAYKAFIRQSWRGRRVSQELYTRANEICPRRGCTLSALIIYSDNAVSLRASQRIGRRLIGYAGFLRWFGTVLPFRSAAVRRLGLRFRHRPVLSGRGGRPRPATTAHAQAASPPR